MNVKRTIVTMLLLISMAGAASAAEPSWYWLMQDKSGNQIYIDNNNVHKTPYLSVVWIKEVYPSGRYMLSQFRIYRNGILDWMFATIRDSQGHYVSEFHPGAKYQHTTIVPGSIFEVLYYACYGTSVSNNYR